MTDTTHLAVWIRVGQQPGGVMGQAGNEQPAGGGYKDKTVQVWNGATGELVQTLPEHKTGIEALAFSPDGTRLACGATLAYTGGQRITLWDTETWRALGTANDTSEYMYDVVSLAFSPDGQLVAGGSSDCLVFAWHTESRRRR